MSRERVIGLLWPDAPAESGRHSLDQLLSLTRRQFGDMVFTGIDPLRLDPAVISSDVSRFETAIASKDFMVAVGEYAGSFLDGFYLSEAGEFERWADTERARLAHLYRDALEHLARTDTAKGDHRAAVGWWRRLVHSDPLASQGALGLMRALAAAGDRPGAIQHARVYEALVRQQLDMPPDPSVTAFVEQLRAAPASSPPMPAPATRPELISATAPVTADEHPTEPPAAIAPRRPRVGAWVLVTLVVGVLALWVVAGRPGMSGASTTSIRSIAVLPFDYLGGKPEEEYLSEGVTDELITALQRMPGLQVAPRSSSVYYKRKNLPSREVGKLLGVDAVVEGSLRREGSRIRVVAHLVETATGHSIWSDVYDQQNPSALTLQEEVAQSIAASVLNKVRPGGAPAIPARRLTSDSTAYDLYQQGRFFLNRRTDMALERAVEKFQGAIARDSSFALAWAGLADSYSLQTTWGGVAPKDAFPLAKVAAQRALRLDSSRAEVHTSLGIISLFYDWNWPEAKHHFERAIELDPEYAPAHQFYAWYLESQDQQDAAVGEMVRATQLEPFSVIITTRLGSMLGRHRTPAEALAPLQRAIQLDSTDANPRFDLAITYTAMGLSDSALRYVPPLGLHLGNFEGGVRALVMARAGRIAEGRRLLAEMIRLRGERYVSGEAMAVAYAALGQKDRAFVELNRAVTDHSFLMPLAKRNLTFASLRGDPRFAQVLARVGLP